MSFGRRGEHYRSTMGIGAHLSDGTVEVARSTVYLSNGLWFGMAGVGVKTCA